MRLLWLNEGNPLHLHPTGAFKIRRYKPDWGSLDHRLDDPHRAGSENLSSLSGSALVEHWPWAIALVELMRKFYEWHDDNQDITLFAYQETKNLPGNARQSILDSEARILTVFEKLLTRGIEEGEFNIDDPKLIAHDIVVLGHAWALRRWHLKKHWTLKTYVKEQTDAILRTVMVDNNTGVTNRQRKESSK